MSGPLTGPGTGAPITAPFLGPVATDGTGGAGGGALGSGGTDLTGGGEPFTGGGGDVSFQEVTGGGIGFAFDAPMSGGFEGVLPFTGVSTIPLAIAGLVAAVAGALMRLLGRRPVTS